MRTAIVKFDDDTNELVLLVIQPKGDYKEKGRIKFLPKVPDDSTPRSK